MLREVEAVVLDPHVVQVALDDAVERIVGDRGEQRQAELRRELDRLGIELAGWSRRSPKAGIPGR